MQHGGAAEEIRRSDLLQEAQLVIQHQPKECV